MTWKPRNMEEIAIPVSWLNWIFGLGIMEFPTHTPRPIFSGIYTCTLGIIYFAIFFGGISYFDIKIIPYEKLILTIILAINMVVAFGSIVSSWIHADIFREIRIRLVAMDNTLMKIGMEPPHDRVFKRILRHFIIWICLIVSLTIVDVFSVMVENDYKVYITLYFAFILHFPTIINFVVDFSFVTIIRCLAMRHKEMNKLIHKAANNFELTTLNEQDKLHRFRRITVLMGSNIRRDYVRHFVETIMQVHLEIVRLTQLINKAYGIQMWSAMAVHFTMLLCTLYCFYFTIVKPDENAVVDLSRFFTMVLWMMVIVCKVVMCNDMCESFNNEVKVTSEAVRELKFCYMEQDMSDLVQQFCLQLILHPIYFSACGYIRLDNTCTRAFFGTVTTYLVILIQISSTPTAFKSLTTI